MVNEKIAERAFSVELKSKSNLKNMTLSNGGRDTVLLEGTLGELQHAEFAEGTVLHIVGSKGVLSVDLGEGGIRKPSGNTGSLSGDNE